MNVYNSGKVEFENEVIINADLNVFGHRYSANGVETDKSAYSFIIDNDGNNGG